MIVFIILFKECYLDLSIHLAFILSLLLFTYYPCLDSISFYEERSDLGPLVNVCKSKAFSFLIGKEVFKYDPILE